MYIMYFIKAQKASSLLKMIKEINESFIIYLFIMIIRVYIF